MTTIRKDTPMPDDNQHLNRSVKTPDMRMTLVRPWFVLARHEEPEPAGDQPVDYRTCSPEEFRAELARLGVKPTTEKSADPRTSLADELAEYGLAPRSTR